MRKTNQTLNQQGCAQATLKEVSADSAYCFVKLAKEYLEAAHVLNKHYHNHPFWPTYLLACHGLELCLKGVLRSKSISVESLKKKLGHDLSHALRMAKEMGLGEVVACSAEEAHMVEVLNRVYRNHDFKYRASGEWELYPPDRLISFLTQICSEVEVVCRGS